MYSGAAAPTEQIEFVSHCSLNLIVAFFFAANETRLRVVRGVLFLLIPEPCCAPLKSSMRCPVAVRCTCRAQPARY